MDNGIDENADYEHLLGDLNIASARLTAHTTVKSSHSHSSEPASSEGSDIETEDSDKHQQTGGESQDASSDEQESYDYEKAGQSPGSEDVDDVLQNYMEQAALQSLLHKLHGADAEQQLTNQLYAASIARSGASPAMLTNTMSHFLTQQPDEDANKRLLNVRTGQHTVQASVSHLITPAPPHQHQGNHQQAVDNIGATTSSQLPTAQHHDKQRDVTCLESIEEEEGQQADDDFEWFEELSREGPLPKGRLGVLYAALSANRQLSQYVKDVVVARVEKAIDDNWGHMMAVRSAPETMKSTKQHTKTSVRSRFHADPLRKAMGPGGQMKDLRPTRFWMVDGQAPEPNEDTLQLSAQLSGLPATYDRARWSRSLTEALRRGVQAEIQAHLTEQALQEAQESLTAIDGDEGPAGGGIQLVDLTQRFKEIQAIEPDSEEGYRLCSLFTDEQWARVSAAHVIEKSGVDCKHHWLYIVRASRPWSSEETLQLHKLVQELGKQNWEAVARKLDSGRTAVQCLQAYIKTARPEGHATKGRSLWSPEDTAMLEQLVAKHGTQWVSVCVANEMQKISAEFGGKYDRHQLRDRWHGQAAQRASRKVGRWSPDEDDKLQKAIQEHGLKWRPVSAYVGTRTPQQCRERYDNIFKPSITHGPWTDAEEDKLKEVVQKVLDENGRIVWGKVSALMVNRTDDMCKRAWRQLQEAGTIITRKPTTGTQITLTEPKRKTASKQPPRRGKNKRKRQGDTTSEEEEVPESLSESDDHHVDQDEVGNDHAAACTLQQQATQQDEGIRITSGRGRGANRGRGRGRGRGRSRAASAITDMQPVQNISGEDAQAELGGLAVPPSLTITMPVPGGLEASKVMQAAPVAQRQKRTPTTAQADTMQVMQGNNLKQEQGLHAQSQQPQRADVLAFVNEGHPTQAGMHIGAAAQRPTKRTRRPTSRLAGQQQEKDVQQTSKRRTRLR